MRIIAYTYEADVHCPACTRVRFKDQSLTGLSNDYFDEHWLRCDLTDNEGNSVHPVFSTDKHSFTNCSDCSKEI